MKQTSIFKHVNGTKPTASRDFQFDLPIESKQELNQIKKSSVPTAVTVKESQRLARSKKRNLAKTINVSKDQPESQSKSNKKRKINEIDDLKEDLRKPKKLKIDEIRAPVFNKKIQIKPLNIQPVKAAGDKRPKLALSASTLALVKKAKASTKPLMIPKKNAKEDEISLSKLSNSDKISQSQSEETKTEIPQISSQTAALIQNLKKSHPTPIISNNHGLTIREQHQDLLVTHRQIVIPSKYKALIQLQIYLDMSINFLKTRGKSSEFIPLKEIQTSIASSQGKFLSISNFRQIIQIQPSFYEHKWVILPSISQTDPQLCIKYTGAQIVTKQEQDIRQKKFTDEIIAHTAKIHFKFIQKLSETEIVDPIFNDPLAIQMWHNKFEPHSNSMITDIPMAALNAQPNHMVQHRSGSIKNFVKTLNPKNDNIIQRAIREASQEPETKSKRSSRKSSPTKSPQKITDPRLLKMSQQHGISLETLTLIQQKRDQQEKHKADLQKTQSDQKSEKQMQEMTLLQDMMRHHFSIKQKQSLKLDDLASSIIFGQSKFKNRSQVISQIVKMAELVPEFIQIKVLMIQGKQTRFVKMVGGKKMTSADVNSILKQKLV